jgi:hypothetical protein
MEHGWKILGYLLLVVGLLSALTLKGENWKIERRVWERVDQAGFFVCIIVFLVGIFLTILGCGASLPQPTDPVHVDVVACEPTLGGTPGQYLKMSAWCREVALCAATMLEVRNREAVRVTAERYAEQLGEEFDEYSEARRTDCYCGPVCLEATTFLKEARSNGLFCRGP